MTATLDSSTSIEQIAEKVRHVLQAQTPGGVTLEVVEDQIHWHDGWWQVVVRPSAWPRKRYEYYEALAEIEEALQETEHLNVLIATGEPANAV